MRFTSIFAVAIAGLSAIVSAAAIADTAVSSSGDNPIGAPISTSVVEAGVKFNIEWTKGSAEYVDLILRKGNSSSLDEVQVITTRLPNVGLFFWTPSKDLEGDDDYAIEIMDHDDTSVINYSAKFTIKSNGKGISSTSTSAKATATSSASKTSKTGSASGVAEAEASSTDDSASSASGAAAAEVSTFKGAAGKVQLGSWATMGAAAMIGMIAGAGLVL